MKLVVDTNVLLSGALWTGESASLLDAILQGRATLCLSESLLGEFTRVLHRSKFSARIKKSGREAQTIIAQLRAATVIATPLSIAAPVSLRDPDDVHVLACAAAIKASAIVTGDQDLLVLKDFEGIPIITVKEALHLLRVPK